MSKTRTAIAAASGAVLAAAATFVAGWEGFYPRTYKDIVGVPTVCYGETEKSAVAEGRKRAYSKQECTDMLAKSLAGYDAAAMACLDPPRPITDNMHKAFISATYNIGVHGFCKSTMARRVNKGDFKGACDALLAWNKAGGRVVKGLDNRRRAERKLCLEGL